MCSFEGWTVLALGSGCTVSQSDQSRYGFKVRKCWRVALGLPLARRYKKLFHHPSSHLVSYRQKTKKCALHPTFTAGLVAALLVGSRARALARSLPAALPRHNRAAPTP